MIQDNLILSKETKSTTSNFGLSGWVMWAILGVVVSGLVILFLYATIKDFINKKKLKKLKIQISENLKEYSRYVIIFVNYLLEINKNYLDDFKPSIGKFKMKQIVEGSKNCLKELLNSGKMKTIIKENEGEYTELIENISTLLSIKSNLWDKKCVEIITYFNNKVIEYDKDIYIIEYQETQEKIESIFANQLQAEEVNEDE